MRRALLHERLCLRGWTFQTLNTYSVALWYLARLARVLSPDARQSLVGTPRLLASLLLRVAGASIARAHTACSLAVCVLREAPMRRDVPSDFTYGVLWRCCSWLRAARVSLNSARVAHTAADRLCVCCRRCCVCGVVAHRSWLGVHACGLVIAYGCEHLYAKRTNTVAAPLITAVARRQQASSVLTALRPLSLRALLDESARLGVWQPSGSLCIHHVPQGTAATAMSRSGCPEGSNVAAPLWVRRDA